MKLTESSIQKQEFRPDLEKFWELAAEKVVLLQKEYDRSQGSPVFTIMGRYTTRGWTEWTQGFQHGIPLLVFLATGDHEMLEMGRSATLKHMAPHITHFGVHDHGFNNLSTYGNLLRASNRGLYQSSDEEKALYRLAIKTSGAVQARRWTRVNEGGYVYSFNGPHSLFIDTMRTLRILLASHLLGHRMLEEGDRVINLLERAVIHGMTTAKYAVYFGEGRDQYDIRGRTAHESIFNINDGQFRCPNSQQGYSGFSTWTRGLSWAMLGFAEFLEFLDAEKSDLNIVATATQLFTEAAEATCDFYLDHSAADGIPYWDTGAPSLHRLGRYQDQPADPFNDFEPVDSSAAAIGAQGLIRLGQYLKDENQVKAERYNSAGWKILKTLLSESYLSTSKDHQGLLLHSVYHRPNGWDHIPEGRKVPCNESSMWGDYHMTELCYLAWELLSHKKYTFFSDLY